MPDRAQALTLEGSIAAVLLVMSLAFALQVSAVTPLTESTSSQHIENQQQEIGENVLAIAAADGTLKSTVLYWDPDEEGYVNASDAGDGAYTSGIPTDADSADVADFGALLNDSFSSRGIAYNLRVTHVDGADLESQAVVNQGQPSSHAVSVTRTVTLYDDDEVAGADGAALADDEDVFYASDMSDETAVYNVVEVELVIWRM